MAFEPKRIPKIITLCDEEIFDSIQETYFSSNYNTEPYNTLALFIEVSSTLDPTDIVFKIQFSNDGGTNWFDLQNDFWGDLRYEDTATADGIKEALVGPCAGRLIRLKVIATGITETKMFTASVFLELYR